MDWILLIWLVIMLMIVFSGRMMRYHLREAVYWQMHLAFVELAMHIHDRHPEAEDAIKHLLTDLKGNSDLHQMEEQLKGTWSKFVDGGRL